MTSTSDKPIPFRKSKRRTDSPSIRPRARVFRAGELVFDGETPIRVLTPRSPEQSAA